MNTLFSAQTVSASSPEFPSEGKFATLLVKGTFGGAITSLEASPDEGTTWIKTEVEVTADGVVNFISGKGVTYRVNLSGATATTNVSAWLTFEI